MDKNMSITKLFLVRNGAGSNKDLFYSATAHTDLTSTTFMLGYHRYCLHCGNSARAVQANIAIHDNYDDSGYRCTCEKAMAEMAERLAFEMGDFSEELSMDRCGSNVRISAEVIQSIVARSKSISIDLFTRSSNGKISLGKSKLNFLRENKYEINRMMKDKYYDYYALSLFVKLVHAKFEEFVSKSEQLHAERLSNYAKVRSEHLFGNTSVKEEA